MTASLLGGALVTGAAGLSADPGAGVFLGACVAGVLFRESATTVRLRTGLLVGTGVGLINALGAIISRGPAEGLSLGADVSTPVGISAVLSWGIAALILHTRQAGQPRDLASALTRVAAAVVGPRGTAITPGSAEGELPELSSRSDQRAYALGVLYAAVFTWLRRRSGSALDWILKTDVRLYGIALAMVLTIALYIGFDAGRFGAVLSNSAELLTFGGFIVAAGEKVRDIRGIRPIRLGRDKPSRH